MVDTASIIIAVISLTGTLAASSIAAWMTVYNEERKRNREADRLIAKYRDPILTAAQDLQSRLHNITDSRLLSWYEGSAEQRDNLIKYTCFLVGEYLSWSYILRRQGQFLSLLTDKSKVDYSNLLGRIVGIFSSDGLGELGAPFALWRGQQMAIGEIMTTKEDGELFCIGFAKFSSQWEQDESFQAWFTPLASSITKMAEAYAYRQVVPDHRMRLLQHLLLELIEMLDPKHLLVDMSRAPPSRAAPNCKCSRAECRTSQRNGEQKERV